MCHMRVLRPSKVSHQVARAVPGLHLMCSVTHQQSHSVSANPVTSAKDNKRNNIACSTDPLYGTILNSSSSVNSAIGDSDVELPLIMANLKLRDVGSEVPDAVIVENMDSQRRITRSCSKPTDFATQNRRCSLKPAKMDVADIESYYLNKKFQKPLARHLETIYEEPVIRKNGSCCILGPKKPRKIIFTGISKAKEKKRKANIKKLSRNFASRRASFSADDFLMHLTGIMLEDVSKTDM
ncbi:uncharacterized protein LOC124615483 isoform X1 [Schistocerca americana]|uniref:uncharacterized protein LOC124615483 isoform X1 n=2 Tax=Schistocerca americana TaxID=7009 RepID=UPI001F501199|nr:uncharacterized protein LOC124615483 isoform X1 [Schistocerca americana]